MYTKCSIHLIIYRRANQVSQIEVDISFCGACLLLCTQFMPASGWALF